MKLTLCFLFFLTILSHASNSSNEVASDIYSFTVNKNIPMKYVQSLEAYYNIYHLVLVKEPGYLTNSDHYNGYLNFGKEAYKRACNVSFKSHMLYKKVIPKGTEFNVTYIKTTPSEKGSFQSASSRALIEFESVDFPDDLAGSIHCYYHGLFKVPNFTLNKLIQTMDSLMIFDYE